MPELPEVETVKRGLEPVFVGQVFSKITLNRPNLRFPFPDKMTERLEGQKCISMRRRGKYIWIDLEGGETLVVHLGMSGSFAINPTDIRKHDHVFFDMRDGHRVTYHDPRRFGYMFFVETGAENKHPTFLTMGEEPLGNAFHGSYLMHQFNNKKTAIKVALLDQSVVAGVGNIYACEALYRAGISPFRPSSDVNEAEAEHLAMAVRDVLQEAIQSGGSTLRDHRQADGAMGYFQHGFQVYDREGEKCPETGGVIERVKQGGRSTFYCSEKQV